jgi:hypothetical protein
MLVGLVTTEVNPDNNGSGEMIDKLFDGIVRALKGRLYQQGVQKLDWPVLLPS